MISTDLFIKRPILSIVVNILILLIGAMSLFTLPIRQYPNLQSATITINTTYPGATQDVIQGFVTTPLAQAVATVSGLDYMTSTSRQGSSMIKLKLVINANADRAMTEVLAKVQQVKYLLPTGAFDPVISKITDGASAVQYIAFSGKSLTVPQLTDFATRVAQPLLTSIPGVASADINGGQNLAMRIWLDPDRLAARGLTAGDVAAALRTNNVQAAPGQLRGDDAVLNITAATDVTAIADFREMVIKRGASTDHGIVRLKDIATLELGGQNYNSSARSNGERSVVIALSPTPDGNPLNIVAHAKKLIPEIQKTAPPGLVIESAFDVTHFVNASISEVQKTLLEALVIVVLVIFLFLGSLRAVVIPIVTIPLSMVGTAALMLALGFSINLLTLLAMVLAIGLVVDDAIVVVQNQLFGMANSVHGASVTPFQPAALPAAAEGLPFQMVLRSPGDFKTLYEDAEKLKAAIFQSGLFVFVDSDLAFDNPSAHVRIDAAKAGELGITMQAIADTLNTLVGENYINRFNYFARSYDVIPQVQKTHRLTPDNIRRYYVRTISNELVPLSTVVNVEVAAQPNKLSQFNQMNSATLSAVIRPGVTMGQAVAFIEGQTLSPGVAIDWMADSRQYVKEGNQLTVSFGLALIVIFLVLAAQYESFRDPLVILVTVPLAMFGALIPLFLDFTTVNIYTQIGLVTLIGLISKHGILMVAFANEIQTTKGYNRHAAIIEAASVRLRPILMTTAAMVAGLVPLIFANGAGAASRFAIGIVVVMGMLIGTLFTLFVLPTFYTLLARDHRPLGAINADAVRGETGRLAAFGTGPFPLV